MRYSEKYKSKIVARMTGPEGSSANALSMELGVSQPTISRWFRNARRLPSMENRVPGDNAAPKKKSRSRWTAEDKLRLVREAAEHADAELGAFLRKNGLHSADLEEWRSLVTALEQPKTKKKRKPSLEERRIGDLQKELNRKDRALAEVTALLALKKKVDMLWGDEEDDTDPKSGSR